LQGKYLSAKFLFEAAGLLAIDADQLEDPEGHESLASAFCSCAGKSHPNAMGLRKYPKLLPAWHRRMWLP
jgi:hypothetical protein